MLTYNWPHDVCPWAGAASDCANYWTAWSAIATALAVAVGEGPYGQTTDDWAN
jgi:hypothetical protein